MDRLPLEILYDIISFVGGYYLGRQGDSDLHSVCLVSSLWRKVGQKVLYRDVDLIWRKKKDLVRTLMERDDLAREVRELAVRAERMGEDVLEPCRNLRTLQVGEGVLRGGAWRGLNEGLTSLHLLKLSLCIGDLPSLPNLTFLHAYSVYFLHTTRPPSSNQPTFIDKLPGLRCLSLVACRGDLPLALLRLPSLRQLTCTPRVNHSLHLDLIPIIEEIYTQLDCLQLCFADSIDAFDYESAERLWRRRNVLLDLKWRWTYTELGLDKVSLESVENVWIREPDGLRWSNPRLAKGLLAPMTNSMAAEKQRRSKDVTDLSFLDGMKGLKRAYLTEMWTSLDEEVVEKLEKRGVEVVVVAFEDSVPRRFAEICKKEKLIA